jgi:hypothetical protein
MMDNMLYIIPYTAEHGRFILSCQMNHALMDKDARFEGDAMNLVQDHLSFTGLVGKKPIFAAGMKMIWGQVAEGWVIATQDVWDHPLRKYNIKRVQTAVRSDFDKGIRFAEWLGLKNEGLMKHYGFDGSDQYRYARIF